MLLITFVVVVPAVLQRKAGQELTERDTVKVANVDVCRKVTFFVTAITVNVHCPRQLLNKDNLYTFVNKLLILIPNFTPNVLFGSMGGLIHNYL